ncbi:ABC transporter ATP-binding protein [Streptomyces qinglanensis]|uniref:Energy-coupling factor transport system ATP-binding protein n=1 Tax=Streptomyces qinglanensis TaxID=943816 RepID=A0A1H9NW19_9ACTN|nr:ABC transporter ATP-binding protein [Streptomyces qinglanensis]SER39543.1 energy-coupling factor transport system ATP-binding protein [Streptomyces qinglanensis]
MITFEQVSVVHDGADGPAFPVVDAHIPEGELCLLVGPSGAGKSTLLGTVAGLVPHFTGGTLRGRVTVAGRDTRTHKPRELADVVGTVGQDPLAHFVTDTVEDELAYGMESLGLPPGTMRRRVEETLDLLGLNELRDRPIASLSGGQQQRVAIGSVLTPHPRVLVLDEPTSALDPPAAEEVLAVLQRLVHDLGTTVLMAEHRLERVVQYADRVLLLAPEGERGRDRAAGPADADIPGSGAAGSATAGSATTGSATTGSGTSGSGASGSGATAPEPAGGGAEPRGTARIGDPAALLAVSPVRPPVVELGELAGWDPLPLSVRDARRRADTLRRRLADRPAPAAAPAAADSPATEARPVAEVSRLGLVRDRVTALHEVSLTLHAGRTTALMGRNGAGKSTLLNTLVGMHRPSSGQVSVGGRTPHRTRPAELLRHVGLVPQEPRDLLYAETVARECRTADADADAAPGTCRALVSRLLPGVPDSTHPRDLSEGQRLALALSIVLTARPPLLLLDEPTRGLDYAAKSRLVLLLRELATQGHAIVLATHDVELVAELAHRVVVLAQGETVADGPTDEVVTSSPAYAPQVSKILAPQPWLTVGQVREAL